MTTLVNALEPRGGCYYVSEQSEQLQVGNVLLARPGGHRAGLDSHLGMTPPVGLSGMGRPGLFE